MRRITLICVSLLLLTCIVFACLGGDKPSTSTARDSQEVRQEQAEGKLIKQIAWDSLSEEEQNDVMGDWSSAKIKVQSNIKQNKPTNKDVYVVTFLTSYERLSSLGPITVFVDKRTKQVIGRALRN